ncbi:MAG TPA: hypothetical protein VN238_06000 [Solirubrobacteraceae bacterium]|nr:hypothetical protein [Solirubrobacteraceae bacterium]
MKRSTKLTVVGLVVAGAAGTAGIAQGVSGKESVAVRALDNAPAAASAEVPALVRQALTGQAASEFGAEVANVRKITASGDRPTLYITTTKEGGACISLESGETSCGSASSVRSGKFGLLTIAPPADGGPVAETVRTLPDGTVLARTLPGGKMTRYGVVPDGVTTVKARSANGAVAKTATVRSNVYKLDLGHEGKPDAAAAIELEKSDGAAVTHALK